MTCMESTVGVLGGRWVYTISDDFFRDARTCFSKHAQGSVNSPSEARARSAAEVFADLRHRRVTTQTAASSCMMGVPFVLIRSPQIGYQKGAREGTIIYYRIMELLRYLFLSLGCFADDEDWNLWS